ncbi:MAG: transcription-repair coupling factor [Clostridia bacterium]|nr:transcription-repair coupling factor [Clostridia bacterium]
MLNKLKKSDYFSLINDVNNKINVSATNLTVAEKGMLVKWLSKPLVFVVGSMEEGEEIESQVQSLGMKTSFVKFVNVDSLYSRYSYNNQEKDLIISLFKLLTNQLDVLIVSAKMLSYRLPKPQVFAENIIEIDKNRIFSIEKIKQKFLAIGYTNQSIIDSQGQFSCRGDCLDIFPINSELPYRISFFDDTVEFIKTFNIETFSSIEEVDFVNVCPNTYLFLENQDVNKIVKNIEQEKNKMVLPPNSFTRLNNIIENLSLEILNKSVSSKFIVPYLTDYNYNILSYIENGTVVFDQVKIICDIIKNQYEDYKTRTDNFLKSGELLSSHKNFLLDFESSIKCNAGKLGFINITNQNRIFETQKLYTFKTEPVINYGENYDLLKDDLEDYLQKKYGVVIFAENDTTCVNTFKTLSEKKLPCQIVKVIEQAEFEKVNIIPQSLYKSVVFVKEKILFLSMNQISSRRTSRDKKLIQSKTQKERVFYTPKVGEWVVHNVHGIGICCGIEKKNFGGIERDYVIIEYRDGDKYYLPTEKISDISSYVSNGAPPRLNKIGGVEFAKEKEKVKESIKKMAINLVALYAERQYQKGFRYQIDEFLYEDFKKGFGFKETDDQLLAIDDIEKDMKEGKIMDRLICGDVGFGKTEVAFRAIFIAAMNGKQVALLCPTTILSEQHYNACMTRLSPYLVNVEVINRFKTPKQQKEILERLKNGKVDVLVGTSKLLSKDVQFKNLGLLVLDEEQKFGVSDKEKLKDIKKNIDVLTLSATPIPRTLHMSMSGIRDISIIETPPENRLPVQTIVCEYSDTLVKDAIYRELKRDGQVLIIYNRVETILTFKQHIESLIPDAVIDVAHGQMPEKVLFSAIKNLYERKTDILISTTLIENGVDLPTANTLICIDSQNLGLSELYQLKGRVGRSTLLAYAYFTYPEHKSITETATKRLEAIQEFSSLGSGFKIAMRDLEIRGAGNVLGAEQHGHISKIGYNMYCKLLREATIELRGQKVANTQDCKIIIDINAFIPNTFVVDNEVRFRLYNTISMVDSTHEMDSLVQKIIEMYGDIPDEVKNLIKIALIQNYSTKLQIKQVMVNKYKTSFVFYDKNDMLKENISSAIKTLNAKVVYNLTNTPIIDFVLSETNLDKKIDFVIKFLAFCNKNVN